MEVRDLGNRVCHGGYGRLPAAWAAHRPAPHGPVAWTAAGAGLTWGAAITGVEWE